MDETDATSVKIKEMADWAKARGIGFSGKQNAGGVIFLAFTKVRPEGKGHFKRDYVVTRPLALEEPGAVAKILAGVAEAFERMEARV